MTASRRSLQSLDALAFFVADVQTGFGPFVVVYLSETGWTQGGIGEALSLGTAVAMASQLPGGAVVDWLRDKRVAAAAAGAIVAFAAVLFALAPTRPIVMLAEALHSFGSSMLGPAVAAISLGLVGRAALGERLGRNARFAALGNGAAAAVLGLFGTYVSNRAVFWLTAVLMIPGLVALRLIDRLELRTDAPGGQLSRVGLGMVARFGPDLVALLRDPGFFGFAGCVVLFHLANAAIMPLAGVEITRQAGATASVIVAACVVLPQTVVAAISPLVGRAADRRGYRLVLTLGYAALPVRALLLAFVTNPIAIVLVQALDGLSAAVFGVMLPAVAAHLTAGNGRFNLCLGALGLAITGGAALSTTLAGHVADVYGSRIAFAMLGGFGAVATAAVARTAPRGTERQAKR